MTVCDDADFQFDEKWWWVAIIISTVGLLYLFIDYFLNIKRRPSPSRLMIIRAIFDYIAVIVVLYAINSDRISCRTTSKDHKICQFWGAVFLFCLYVPAIYYASICWQLYLTLKNPFRQPSDQSILFHLGVLSICLCVVIFVATVGNDGDGQFEYRPAFQICFLKQREGINIWNLFVIYIPTFIIVLGGIFANIWSIKQLKKRILDDTFEFRWIAIKTQTAIITCFTINYILQGINWTMIFQFTEDIPKYDPYILCIFCVLAIVFDAITWFVRNMVHRKSSHQDYITHHNESYKTQETRNKKCKVKIDTISDALRKEVITFITAGLARSAVLNSSKNVKRRRKRSMAQSTDDSTVTSVHSDDIMTAQLLHHLMEYKPIGNFSKIINPHIKEDYFLMNEAEEEKSKSRDYDGHRQYELASVEQEHYMATCDGKESADILTDKYYPRYIGAKYVEHVIEQYPIGVVGADGSHVMFTDYAPVIFGYLRRNVFGVSDEEYKHSILPVDDVTRVSLELIAKFSEGRSGAFFFFTKDMKYLIKTLTKKEAQLLLNQLKKYSLYMSNNRETYLSQYFGLHAIELYSHSIYFVVNKNVFPPSLRTPDETYDIKGSWIDRHTNHHVTEKKLMKDEDLHSELVLNSKQSLKIYEQLKQDTFFLSSLHIMDYSLLLGIYYTKVFRGNRHQSVIHIDMNDGDDDDRNDDNKGDTNIAVYSNIMGYSVYNTVYVEGPGRYCIGIIDMLQKWDINKKTERLVKGLRGKDRNGISCVPPQVYQERFMKKMREIGIGTGEEWVTV